MPDRPERESPPWAKTIAELRSLSDDELISQHDALVAGDTGESIRSEYYRDELTRRVVERQGRWLVGLTIVIAVLTLTNVVLVLVDVL